MIFVTKYPKKGIFARVLVPKIIAYPKNIAKMNTKKAAV